MKNNINKNKLSIPNKIRFPQLFKYYNLVSERKRSKFTNYEEFYY